MVAISLEGIIILISFVIESFCVKPQCIWLYEEDKFSIQIRIIQQNTSLRDGGLLDKWIRRHKHRVYYK